LQRIDAAEALYRHGPIREAESFERSVVRTEHLYAFLQALQHRLTPAHRIRRHLVVSDDVPTDPGTLLGNPDGIVIDESGERVDAFGALHGRQPFHVQPTFHSRPSHRRPALGSGARCFRDPNSVARQTLCPYLDGMLAVVRSSFS